MRIFRHYVSPLKVTLATLDFALVAVSAFAASLALRPILNGDAQSLGIWLLVSLFLAVLSSPIMIGFGVYERDSIGNYRAFITRMALALALAVSVIMLFHHLLPFVTLNSAILLGSVFAAFIMLSLAHIYYRYLVGGDSLSQRVLVLGAGERGETVYQQMVEAVESGLKPVGFVPLENCEAPPQFTHKDSVLPNLGGASDLLEIVAKERIDMVIITSSAEEVLPLQYLISLKLSGVKMIGHMGFYEEIRGYVKLSDLRPEWLLFADGFYGAGRLELAAKRAVDIVISSLVLLLSSPLTMTAALLVVSTSRGGIFYKQVRTGLRGKPFGVLKFRTMVQDAEKAGAQWAQANDPRVTAVGRFLRASRIDEIPQVLNVLKGDMSFVGPRPERPEFIENLVKEIPYYNERHFVKPGITGWAQIRFPYGASIEDAKRKLEYDLYYIKNYSLFLDVLIILQTARVVLFQKGAR